MWNIDEFTEELTCAGLCEHTIASYKLHAVRFTEWCGANSIDSPKHLTDSVVLRYGDTMIDQRICTAGWKYAEKLALRRYFAFLQTHGDILIAPTIAVKKPNVLSGHYLALDRNELQSLLDRFPTDTDADLLAKSILETAYSAALRPGEIRRLEIEDVDFAEGQLFIKQSKGRKDRVAPIGNTACTWLKRYIAEVRPRFVRDSSERTVYIGTRSRRPFRHTAIAEFIRYRLERSGFPSIALHQLRASAATHLVESGADTAFVQRILGHTDIDTTRTYVQIDHRALVSKLAESHPRASFSSKRSRS